MIKIREFFDRLNYWDCIAFLFMVDRYAKESGDDQTKLIQSITDHIKETWKFTTNQDIFDDVMMYETRWHYQNKP